MQTLLFAQIHHQNPWGFKTFHKEQSIHKFCQHSNTNHAINSIAIHTLNRERQIYGQGFTWSNNTS